MANFDYFYYENVMDASNPLDPRRILNDAADGVLSLVADGASAALISSLHGKELVQALVDVGAIRREGGRLMFDTPVILAEDAAELSGLFAGEAANLAERLAQEQASLHRLAGRIDNGFDARTNLYHVLCGMVLDGMFFDDLCAKGCVAVSRRHPSGLDYISVIYERCEALDRLSRRLLCSWNRLSDGRCALQSFGDADGARHDLYRGYRLQELSQRRGMRSEAGLHLPPKELLSEAYRLLEADGCSTEAMRTLTRYGYVLDGRICVPVFRACNEAAVRDIGVLVSKVLLEPVTSLLTDCELDITAVRHGVSRAELANELYHILFGQINEELVTLGVVAAPRQHPGEGRYLKSIQLFGWEEHR